MRRAVSIVAAFALSAVAACDRLPGRPDPDAQYKRPSEILSFNDLYATNCAGCHGNDGTHGAAHPMNDPVYLAIVPDDVLTTVIADGVPRTLMPAFGERSGGALTDEQVGVIVNGMRQRWATPDAFDGVSLPAYAATGGGSAERGGRVFQSACARCHGADGTGGRGGGSVVDPSFLDLVSDQSLRVTVIAGRPDLGKPDFRTIDAGRPLTNRQVNDLVAWLASHRRTPGQ